MAARKPAAPSRPLFGEKVIEMGFCGAQDVEKALKIQREQDRKGEKHRLLGIVMIGEGMLSTAQLIELLQEHVKSKA